MSIDLDNPEILKQIATAIRDNIDIYAQNTYDGGHRKHLGASIIGNDCSRALWYTFRWIYHKKYEGRMQRLFQRGHLEELRYTEYLRGLGFTVTDRDDSYKLYHNVNLNEYKWSNVDSSDYEYVDVTGNDEHETIAAQRGIKYPQMKVSDVNGHFGGSIDGELQFPPTWGIPGKFLTEFKTKGTGAGFTKLKTKGVKFGANEHWVQMCIYGRKRGYTHAVYFSTNKNDDDMHVEMLKLDWSLADDMLRKAERVIYAKEPPQQISKEPTNFKCSWCDYKDHCHYGAKVEVNCRSCEHASPIDDGLWACSLYGSPIPDATIKTGCATHKPIV